VDMRPISMTRPRMCWKIKYRNRSDTPGSCRPAISAGQRSRHDFWHPTGHLEANRQDRIGGRCLTPIRIGCLDTPAQPTIGAHGVLGDEPHERGEGRSSSAAKKAEAAFKISLARRSSAFSRRNRFNSADSSAVVPAR
jgi:hypothetical protein